jgi:hypothetical protein
MWHNDAGLRGVIPSTMSSWLSNNELLRCSASLSEH